MDYEFAAAGYVCMVEIAEGVWASVEGHAADVTVLGAVVDGLDTEDLTGSS